VFELPGEQDARREVDAFAVVQRMSGWVTGRPRSSTTVSSPTRAVFSRASIGSGISPMDAAPWLGGFASTIAKRLARRSRDRYAPGRGGRCDRGAGVDRLDELVRVLDPSSRAPELGRPILWMGLNSAQAVASAEIVREIYRGWLSEGTGIRLRGRAGRPPRRICLCLYEDPTSCGTPDGWGTSTASTSCPRFAAGRRALADGSGV
jgi:hypothetical protein